MSHFRTTPTYDLPLTVGKNTHVAWWRWFQDIDLGAPPSSELPITLSGSPFTYSAKMKGNLIVNGGSVSLIEFSRTKGTYYTTGQTAGMFNLAANDLLRVTYSSPPTVTFVPI